MISIIVAASTNNVIGVRGELPWRLRDDLKRFKQLTLGKPVIMGRRTFESIGRPLPGRDNIVITTDRHYQADGCRVVHSIDQALVAAGDCEEVMIIGGADLYRQTLETADRLYLTLVKAAPEGDTWFPVIEPQQWREIERESHQADEHNEFDYDFVVLDRIR